MDTAADVLAPWLNAETEGAAPERVLRYQMEVPNVYVHNIALQGLRDPRTLISASLRAFGCPIAHLQGRDLRSLGGGQAYVLPFYYLGPVEQSDGGHSLEFFTGIGGLEVCLFMATGEPVPQLVVTRDAAPPTSLPDPYVVPIWSRFMTRPRRADVDQLPPWANNVLTFSDGMVALRYYSEPEE